jgi:23S rRNA (cytidine1920-2'-O)/16S rRNA (cytidine1409-2'-O)-methyltransferase
MVMERTNVRDLQEGALVPVPDVCVVDVSFISLRTITPNLLAISDEEADFVLLIKPQYEAGRHRVGRGGIVRDPSVHRAVLDEVVTELASAELVVAAVVPSPLRGADGNVEFVAHARRDASRVSMTALDVAIELVPTEAA